jgi:hypothetical protein
MSEAAYKKWLESLQAKPATPATQPEPAPSQQPETQAEAQTQPSGTEAFLRGGAEGASLGMSDELTGAAKAIGVEPVDFAMAYAKGPIAMASYLATKAGSAWAKNGNAGIVDDYRVGRDEARTANKAAEKAHGGLYTTGKVAGGVVTAATAAPASIPAMVATGGGMGAAAGLGESEADLTRGQFKEAAVDAAKGAGVGMAAGAVGGVAAKALPTAAKSLRELGRGRLFKAAVGQNKKAFTQINGKGLLDKSGQYLDEMGIGFGDSTESIAAKLAQRNESLDGSLESMVGALDSTAKVPRISPFEVAARIEKQVAEPLKRIAANRDEYAQIMREVEGIRELGKEGVSFTEAAAQRRAVQQKINYDKRNGLDAAAEAKSKIAQIWNDIIDEKAEPLLKSMGKGGDSYRELRHEAGLVKELLKHVKDRAAGNAANRAMSPSDYGAGAIGGIMTSNPFVGAAAAAANHLARVYGNAAAGRTAINMARMISTSPRAAKSITPAIARAMQRFEQPVPAMAKNKEGATRLASSDK